MQIKKWPNDLGWWVRHADRRYEVITICPSNVKRWGVRPADQGNAEWTILKRYVLTPQEAVLSYLGMELQR